MFVLMPIAHFNISLPHRLLDFRPFNCWTACMRVHTNDSLQIRIIIANFSPWYDSYSLVVADPICGQRAIVYCVQRDNFDSSWLMHFMCHPVKVDKWCSTAIKEHSGCWSSFYGLQSESGYATEVRDAWLLSCQTHGYLPSIKTFPSWLDRSYILVRWRVHRGVNNLPRVVMQQHLAGEFLNFWSQVTLLACCASIHPIPCYQLYCWCCCAAVMHCIVVKMLHKKVETWF